MKTSGTLYVVATPIGNLDDASARSIEVLRGAGVIACEDTRTSGTLLARYGISVRTVALHEHNERAAAAGLIGELRRGLDVALVSDAGTPALSDPGAHFVAEAHKAGIRVRPVPGPSAAARFSARLPCGGFLFWLSAAAGAARTRAIGRSTAVAVVLYGSAPTRRQGAARRALGAGARPCCAQLTIFSGARAPAARRSRAWLAPVRLACRENSSSCSPPGAQDSPAAQAGQVLDIRGRAFAGRAARIARPHRMPKDALPHGLARAK